jgi:hypothetical protein
MPRFALPLLKKSFRPMKLLIGCSPFVYYLFLQNWVSDSHKDYVSAKFGQNPLKDVDSRVFTRMLHGKQFTQ